MITTVFMVRHAESPFKKGEERTRGLSQKGFDDVENVTVERLWPRKSLM